MLTALVYFKYESEKTRNMFSRGGYDARLELQSIVANRWCGGYRKHQLQRSICETA